MLWQDSVISACLAGDYAQHRDNSFTLTDLQWHVKYNQLHLVTAACN